MFLVFDIVGTCWQRKCSLVHPPCYFWRLPWVSTAPPSMNHVSIMMATMCYEMTPISFFTLLYFDDSFLVMWSSCDHIVTHCTCDGYCSVMSIVLWPIVQGDSIVPVTPIVLVTLLFSFTISTSSLWPYSLRLDFCILRYRQAIRVLIPTLFPCSPVSRLFALRPLIA